MARPFADNQYPAVLVGGNVVTRGFLAIQDRLKQIFPPSLYTHRIVPPKISPEMWKTLIAHTPMIGIGWAGWVPTRQLGTEFRGDLVFAVFLLTKQRKLEDLYLGDGKVPGVFGESAMATFMLHNFIEPDIGRCVVRQCTAVGAADWVPDGQAIVAMDVAIENVGFDCFEWQQQLDAFLRRGEQFQVDGADQPATTLTIGDPS
ncbi:hypothetical protein JUN65_02060 [Gluconacetobacter azotocaptans]|uniref:hypothetical protein n=1 Tax=Gluconacetobacter azotocaptans TaxID=142834 RepID=UPI00195D6B6A|nr:hypothetical protein [Gluconacetobacter azotocaptans]MBM9400378.1 hypothetical protein [Gluconacetobacter azotocaptans]